MTIRQWMADHLHLMETLACLVLIIIGLAFLHSFPQLASAIFITAFLIGGYASAKTGILDLVKNKHLSVDILMILAAIGAGIIGYWLEGALLIFIFRCPIRLKKWSWKK